MNVQADPNTLTCIATTSFWIAIVAYGGFVFALWLMSPLSVRASLISGLISLACAALATAGYQVLTSLATGIAAEADVPAPRLVAALLLSARAQTYLIIIGLVAGGIGGNLIASALTSGERTQRI